MVKAAIMQPYLFPYIGYFQLVHSVDTFIFLDDVNFINRGWINRNNILVNDKAHTFTVPLSKKSQNKLIKDIPIVDGHIWKQKTINKLYQAYKKAPFFEQTFECIKKTLESKESLIGNYAAQTVIDICDHLSINQKFDFSSNLAYDRSLKKEEKIIAINKAIDSHIYINPISGSHLYNKKMFQNNQLELKFLKADVKPYRQHDNTFIPSLSIIDVLMFNSKEEVRSLISQYSVI